MCIHIYVCMYLLHFGDGFSTIFEFHFTVVWVSFVWIRYLLCSFSDDDVMVSESVGRRRRRGRSAALPSTLVTATYFKKAHIIIEEKKHHTNPET